MSHIMTLICESYGDDSFVFMSQFMTHTMGIKGRTFLLSVFFPFFLFRLLRKHHHSIVTT